MEVKLKEFREMYELSQREAAESIGIDQRQWSRYENGINEFPTRYLVQLCKIYHVSADWILGLKEKR